MAPFRWPKVEHDIALCKEYIDYRPKKHEDWECLASTLSSLFDLNEPLKARGCREHLDLLIKKYKAEERKTLKRSGTEEEYSELTRLLEDISSYVADNSIGQNDEQGKKKKEEQDKMKGMEMRKAAMETHSKRKFKENDEDESTDESSSNGVQTKKSTKRVGTSQMLDYLSQKHSDNLSIRGKKLELEERRLELEEKKIKLEQIKWEAMLQSQK